MENQILESEKIEEWLIESYRLADQKAGALTVHVDHWKYIIAAAKDNIAHQRVVPIASGSVLQEAEEALDSHDPCWENNFSPALGVRTKLLGSVLNLAGLAVLVQDKQKQTDTPSSELRQKVG